MMGSGGLEDGELTWVAAENWPAQLPRHICPTAHATISLLAQVFLCSPTVSVLCKQKIPAQRDYPSDTRPSDTHQVSRPIFIPV